MYGRLSEHRFDIDPRPFIKPLCEAVASGRRLLIRYVPNPTPGELRQCRHPHITSSLAMADIVLPQNAKRSRCRCQAKGKVEALAPRRTTRTRQLEGRRATASVAAGSHRACQVRALGPDAHACAGKTRGGKHKRKLNISEEFTGNLVNSSEILSLRLCLPPCAFSAQGLRLGRPGPDIAAAAAGPRCEANGAKPGKSKHHDTTIILVVLMSMYFLYLP